MKTSNKRGIGSGKVNKGSRSLRIPKTEEIYTMLRKVRSDVYDYTLPVDISTDTTIKKRCLEETKNLLKVYGERCLVSSAREGFIPEGADKLSSTLYLAPEDPSVPDDNPDLYLARQKEGIPLKFFLAYAKGRAFVTHSDMDTVQARLGVASAKELEDAYFYVADFLLRKVNAAHRAQEREPVIPHAREVFYSTNVYGDVTVHHYG